MPTSKSTTTEPAAKAEQGASAADMAAEKVPATPPPGAPTLRPTSTLNRRLRADFFTPLKDVPINDDGEIEVPGGAFAQGAAGFAMLAAIEDALRILAIDADAYDAWAASAPDAELMQLFTFVFSTMSPGEAQASLT